MPRCQTGIDSSPARGAHTHTHTHTHTRPADPSHARRAAVSDCAPTPGPRARRAVPATVTASRATRSTATGAGPFRLMGLPAGPGVARVGRLPGPSQPRRRCRLAGYSKPPVPDLAGAGGCNSPSLRAFASRRRRRRRRRHRGGGAPTHGWVLPAFLLCGLSPTEACPRYGIFHCLHLILEKQSFTFRPFQWIGSQRRIAPLSTASEFGRCDREPHLKCGCTLIEYTMLLLIERRRMLSRFCWEKISGGNLRRLGLKSSLKKALGQNCVCCICEKQADLGRW